MRRGLAIAVIVAAASAASLPAFSQPSVIKNVDWLKKPTAGSLLAVWPTAAYKTGKGGRAVIHCKVGLEGGLFDCKVLEEAPAGAGFGAAGLTLTPQFLMKPATKDGIPFVSDVTIPLKFPDFTVTKSDMAESMFGHQTVISNVSWRTAPGLADVASAYPAKARAESVGGQATLDCDLTKTATLAACGILVETPRGYGFGRAARTLAARFAADTTMLGDKSLKGMAVQVRFTFAPEILTDREPRIGKPRWAAMPTSEQFLAAFPEAANTARIATARIVLACKVQPDGGLAGCGVESEAPTGFGFGKAALSVSSGFRVQLWSDEGLPVVGGMLRVPIRFQIEPAPPAASSPAPPPKP